MRLSALRALPSLFVLVLVPLVGVTGCAGPSPQAQALVEDIRATRERAEDVRVETEGRMRELEEQLAERLAELQQVEEAGDQATASALRALLEQMNAQHGNLEETRDTLVREVQELAQREREVLAEDAGNQAGTLLDLVGGLATAVLGGGAVVGVTQRFGRSRSANSIRMLQEELARVDGKVGAFERGVRGETERGAH